MSSIRGCDQSRRDNTTTAPAPTSSSSRFEDNNNKSARDNPASRHLWVGNVSPRMPMESVLAEHFVRFGPLESISFLPGRSYGFVNFEREEDAVAAKDKLQGFVVADLPLKIEFSKSDKSAASSRDSSSIRRDEQRAQSRSSPFSQREFRPRRASPEPSLPENSRADDGEEIPSEVLWIGFPALLKVDETILRKAFSPFGEIEKISAQPGKTFAFVRFKNLLSSCRAKETLQGKLFGNPRVHIRFARAETGPPSSVRRGQGLNPTPAHFENGHPESFDKYRPDRNFEDLADEQNIRQHSYISKRDYRDPDVVGFGGSEPSWRGGNIAYEQQRLNDLAPKQGFHGDAHFREFSPPKLPRKHPYSEDPWDSPQPAYDGAKRTKMGPGPFPPPERELPEYPFSGSEGRHGFPRMLSEFPLPDESAHMRFSHVPDLPPNTAQPFGDRSESWKRPTPDLLQPPSHDPFHSTPGSFTSNSADWKRPTDFHQPPVSKEWKWEGTIAKGGTPVCRARCFPVGRVLDIMLPELLDCTARTGLEMLAKHYYQAADTWVVFFVPHTDADIGFYNEFMNYLGEKQRAAVAKIDERNTLFLVPPSEFSEKVLKVPGRLSMSGVVLRLEPPSSNTGLLQSLHERRASQFLPPQSNIPYQRSDSPSGLLPPGMSHQNMEKSGFGGPAPSFSLSSQMVSSSLSGYDNALPDAVDRRQEYPPNLHTVAFGSNSPHQLHGLITDSRNASSHGTHGATVHVQEPNMGSYISGYAGSLSGSSSSFEDQKPSASLPTPLNSLQPEQLAMLASSLLGQQRQQLGSTSAASGSEDYRSSTMNHPGNLPAQRQAYQVPSEPLTTQYGQQQQSAYVPATNAPAVAQSQVSQQPRSNANTQEEGEADPQRRLQATLQLAAALLQQIQQGKGT
ncbi:hypothetical protein Droror1_Dr00003372 [Drosera rotundifolia]